MTLVEEKRSNILLEKIESSQTSVNNRKHSALGHHNSSRAVFHPEILNKQIDSSSVRLQTGLDGAQSY